MTDKQTEALTFARKVLNDCHHYINDAFTAYTALEAALAEQPAQDNTYGYAKNLAEAMFQQHFASDEHYASGRVVWGVNDTVIGILTQIDNMVADMVRRPAQQQEPVAWYDAEKDCAYTLADCEGRAQDDLEPLYLAPASKQWVDLTEKDKREARNSVSYSPLAMTMGEWTEAVQNATEAKLREKNA